MNLKKKTVIILIILLIIKLTFPILESIANDLAYIEFLDENLKEAIIEQGIDTNNDGEISLTEAESVTKLYLYNKSIESISGIEYFCNLYYLDIRYNYIENIEPLNKLNNLKFLYIAGNKINSTPLRKVDNNTEVTINNLLRKNVTIEGIYNQIVDYDAELSKNKPIHKVLFVYVTNIDANVINNGNILNYKHTLSNEEIYWFDLQKELFEKTVEKLSNYSVDIVTSTYKTTETIKKYGGYNDNYWLDEGNISEIDKMICDYDTIFICSIYDNLIVPHEASGLGNRGNAMIYFSNYSLEDVEKLENDRPGDWTASMIHEFIHSVEGYGIYIDYNMWEWHTARTYFNERYYDANDEFLAMSYYLQGGKNPENESEVGIVKEIWEIPLSKVYNKNMLINKEQLQLNATEEKELYCITKKANYEEGEAALWTYKDIIWESSNENVAIVDKNGKVTALSKGECNIVARDSTKIYSAICTVNVIGKQLSKIEVTTLPEKITYAEGQNFDQTGMQVMATYDDGSTQMINDYIIIDGTNLTADKISVTISYTEYGIEKTTTQEITVSHVEVVNEKIDPTCTKIGLTEGKYCSECENVLVKQEEIPALGHNYENGICTTCGEMLRLTIMSHEYIILEEHITKVPNNTTLENFKKIIETNAEEIKILDKNSQELGEEDIIATGMRLILKLGNETKEFKLIVWGDTTGDGKADFKDMVSMNKHRLNKQKLEDEYLIAGDITEDNEVDFKDIVKLNKYRLNKILQLF